MPISLSWLLNPSDSTRRTEGGGYIPFAETRPRKARCGIPRLARTGASTFAALGLAVLAGTLVYFFYFSFNPRSEHVFPLPVDTAAEHASFILNSPMTIPDGENLTLEQLRSLVSRTKGYWARDYSLHLGWNNMRYIIESALLHGALLNRTVILPSFIYARSCEYDVAVCAQFAHMVNRGDAVHSDEWRSLPMDGQMAWRLPISVMLNMTLLRNTQPVITVSEYLRLHNISEDTELSDGHWERQKYHTNPYIFDKTNSLPSLHVIENHWFDPSGINRVDVLPEDMKKRGGWSAQGGDLSKDEVGSWSDTLKTTLNSALEGAFSGRPRVLDWDRAREVLEQQGRASDVQTDEGMERILNENGWEVLYTYSGARGMDYVKNVVNPIRQVAPRRTLRGLREDYGHLTADVVLLTGEVHYERKPGSLRFTTAANRELFSRLVLYRVHAPFKVYELAAKLAVRLKELNGGRMWLGAHMRRGDFGRINWVMEQTIQGHLSRIQNNLAKGRTLLRSLKADDLTTYNIPDITPDRTVTQSQPPQNGDKFFLATDERDPSNIAYLADHGAVLTSKLLTIDDRRAFGWPLMLTDVLGLVEQALLAHADFFYAQALSSFAGGTVNIRAMEGRDPRTAVID